MISVTKKQAAVISVMTVFAAVMFVGPITMNSAFAGGDGFFFHHHHLFYQG
jgi:hypothetical protein